MSTVTGQDTVVRMMTTVSVGVRPAMVQAMTAFSTDLSSYIKMKKLMGQVLNRRSGRLQRSVHGDVTETGTQVSGSAATNVEYAAAHEYGIQRNVVVSAHFRMQTMAFGRRMKTPREVLVNQHASYSNLPEKSFMRSGLADKAESGITRIRTAMAELIAGAKP